MKKIIPVLCLMISSIAFANPPMNLECRVDTVQSSIPRKVVLRDGMIESIGCNQDTCRDKDLEIMMNYNSHYSTVSLKVWDHFTGQAVETQYDDLRQGKKIQYTAYNIKDKRFLRIDCDVL